MFVATDYRGVRRARRTIAVLVWLASFYLTAFSMFWLGDKLRVPYIIEFDEPRVQYTQVGDDVELESTSTPLGVSMTLVAAYVASLVVACYMRLDVIPASTAVGCTKWAASGLAVFTNLLLQVSLFFLIRPALVDERSRDAWPFGSVAVGLAVLFGLFGVFRRLDSRRRRQPAGLPTTHSG